MSDAAERERMIVSIKRLMNQDKGEVASLLNSLVCGTPYSWMDWMSDDALEQLAEAEDDEPPLSDYELRQLAEAEEDIAAGDLIPWEEARARLEKIL